MENLYYNILQITGPKNDLRVLNSKIITLGNLRFVNLVPLPNQIKLLLPNEEDKKLKEKYGVKTLYEFQEKYWGSRYGDLFTKLKIISENHYFYEYLAESGGITPTLQAISKKFPKLTIENITIDTQTEEVLIVFIKNGRRDAFPKLDLTYTILLNLKLY